MVAPRYQKNRKITVYKGGRKLVDGYFIGYSSLAHAREVAESTKLPPVGAIGQPEYYPGTGNWNKNTQNDEFIAEDPEDARRS